MADGATTWFPLWADDGFPASQTGTGVWFHHGQPVNGLKAFLQCTAGNTVTVTMTGK